MANDLPASDESIQELLVITDAHKLIDTMKVQVQAMIRTSSKQATQGRTVTPERQAVLDRMQAKMEAALDEMLNWDALQAMYLRTYRASFTQDELDGMMAFYNTSAGQARIKKKTLVMQNEMGEMQGMMKPIQVKLLEIKRETNKELEAL